MTGVIGFSSLDGRIDCYQSFASGMADTLSHVYWIGGSPCSGKSMIADALSAKYGLPVYRCDEAYFLHQNLIAHEHQPIFHRLSHASCDELWMRPVKQQIREAFELYREEFPFILDDLAHLAQLGPVIAEGAALLPQLLSGIGVDDSRSVWIVPTEEFQQSNYAFRSWRHNTLEDCSEKDRAWRNWMARDACFAREVTTDARRLRREVRVIDGSEPVESVVDFVSCWFQLD